MKVLSISETFCLLFVHIVSGFRIVTRCLCEIGSILRKICIPFKKGLETIAKMGGIFRMTPVLFYTLRTFLITIMTVGMMASLTEFRFSRRKLLCILAIFSIWVIVSSLVLLWIGGELLLLRLFYFTISIPSTILTYWAANDSPAQAVFNYMTQIMVSALSASLIRWLTESLGLSLEVNVLLMCVFYGTAIYLEYRFLRRPFRMLIQVMPSRWGVLTMIPCVFCLFLIFLSAWPNSHLENTAQRLYVYAAIIPLTVVYLSVFKSLLAQYRSQMERHDAALLTVQVSALNEKLLRVKELEEDLRIQRHDLRHQFQTVTELVARGDQNSALAFLDAAQKRLDERKEILWCPHPVLDAVFSFYFDQARRQNVRIEAKISLPDKLPVNESELAVVLANALENALHANLKLPVEQRVIYCRAVGSPSLMFELSNPCCEPVVFDGQGLPVAQSQGHGLGVQSIAAFCKKNGAVCRFELANGTFRLQLVL